MSGVSLERLWYYWSLPWLRLRYNLRSRFGQNDFVGSRFGLAFSWEEKHIFEFESHRVFYRVRNAIGLQNILKWSLSGLETDLIQSWSGHWSERLRTWEWLEAIFVRTWANFGVTRRGPRKTRIYECVSVVPDGWRKWSIVRTLYTTM